MAKLVITIGNERQLFELPFSATIGRYSDNTIILDDASISTHHARIVSKDGCYRVCDLHSTNGTTVNGLPILDKELNDGDTITFGAVKCLFTNPVKTPYVTAQSRLDHKKGGTTIKNESKSKPTEPPITNRSNSSLRPLVVTAIILIITVTGGVGAYYLGRRNIGAKQLSSPISTVMPPKTEKMEAFINEGHRLISALDTGLDINEFHDRVIELKASAQEAMNESKNPQLNDDLTDFSTALDDTYVLWSNDLHDNQDGNFRYNLMRSWTQNPEKKCDYYHFKPSSYIIVKDHITFFINPIQPLLARVAEIFSIVEKQVNYLKTGISNQRQQQLDVAKTSDDAYERTSEDFLTPEGQASLNKTLSEINRNLLIRGGTHISGPLTDQQLSDLTSHLAEYYQETDNIAQDYVNKNKKLLEADLVELEKRKPEGWESIKENLQGSIKELTAAYDKNAFTLKNMSYAYISGAVADWDARLIKSIQNAKGRGEIDAIMENSDEQLKEYSPNLAEQAKKLNIDLSSTVNDYDELHKISEDQKEIVSSQ